MNDLAEVLAELASSFTKVLNEFVEVAKDFLEKLKRVDYQESVHPTLRTKYSSQPIKSQLINNKPSIVRARSCC